MRLSFDVRRGNFVVSTGENRRAYDVGSGLGYGVARDWRAPRKGLEYGFERIRGFYVGD